MRRPEPPERLTAVENEIWRDIVQAVRPDWFRGGSEHVLVLYVQMLAQQRQLQGWLQEVERGERYIELMRLQLIVTMSAANLATKLRLTPRSSFDRYAGAGRPHVAKAVGRYAGRLKTRSATCGGAVRSGRPQRFHLAMPAT
jgi:hypothetical protein